MIKQKKSFLDKIVGSEEEVKHMSVSDVDSEDDEIVEEDVESVGISKEEKADDLEKSWQEEIEGDEEGQLAVDVYQTEDSIVIKSIIGGVKPEDLDLSVTSDMITIKGSRENIDELVSNDYYYQECFWGSFSRSVILPCDIKVDGVEASMKNGVLTVKMPKIEKNTSTKIEVTGE